MKTLHIRTTIDYYPSIALSIGSYWDCSGRQPIETSWEFIGEEHELMLALDTLRNDKDAEFMHVINRTMHR